MEGYIKNVLQESADVVGQLSVVIPDIIKASRMIIDALSAGKKIIIAGNGGSAADAQHFAAEFIGRFKTDRKPLYAIALTTNTSVLTALGNDYSFEVVFSRQLEAVGNEGDVFLAISTSGESRNIIRAVDVAKSKNLKIISLTGSRPSFLVQKCPDICIQVPSVNTPRIQESMLLVEHLLIDLVDHFICSTISSFE